MLLHIHTYEVKADSNSHVNIFREDRIQTILIPSLRRVANILERCYIYIGRD